MPSYSTFPPKSGKLRTFCTTSSVETVYSSNIKDDWIAIPHPYNYNQKITVVILDLNLCFVSYVQLPNVIE